MIEIIPAIIPKSLDDLRIHLSKVKDRVKTVQIDILDGKYTSKSSWPYSNDFKDFVQFENEDNGLPFWDELDYEFDLMIENPEDQFEKFIKVGASSLIFHIESSNRLKECLNKCKEMSVARGIAIKPQTDISLLIPFLNDVEFVQFMGNDHIGENGISLDPAIYDKIKLFKGSHENMTVGVDIGVNFDTAPRLKDVGVTRLVSGSAIFGSADVDDAIKILKEYK